VLSKKTIIKVLSIGIIFLAAFSAYNAALKKNPGSDIAYAAKEKNADGNIGKNLKLTPTPVATTAPSLAPTVFLTETPTPRASLSQALALTPTPTRSVESSGSMWEIKSVSSMKETKDKICGQDNDTFIEKWVNRASELGANFISIATPYDNPSCGESVAYATHWVNAIRAKGLRVWHRHMPLAFEGIYNAPKSKDDFLDLISNFIKNNRVLFAEGDIFTPIPEPQNGGIQGITDCSQGVCQFSGSQDFNKWLREAMDVSEKAFDDIGLGGKIKIGYFGFDGFVAWGDNNPDWNGILEDSTVSRMGNITIDHYPEEVGDTMDNDLSEVEARYPGTPIIIGEWGTITSGDAVHQINDSMGAALNHKSVIGFNYWHMGMGGNESLINDDFSKKPQFETVQSFYKNR
jgi:hypothetical protein